MNLNKVINQTIKSWKLYSSATVFARLQHTSKITETETSQLPSNVVLLGGIQEGKYKNRRKISPKHPHSDSTIIRKCIEKLKPHDSPVRVWVDSLHDVTPAYTNAGLLHPDLFDVHPRMDYVHAVVEWQNKYREVDESWTRTRAEFGHGRKKPWPQKHTGKVRQGSRTPPGWYKGGISHGPKGPRPMFYKLPEQTVIGALTTVLTVRRIQDDMIVIENLEKDDLDAEYLEQFFGNRLLDDNTALVVHNDNELPENLAELLEYKSKITLMPTFALSVSSILHHEKLFITTSAVDELEKKIIWNQRKYPWLGGKPHNFYNDLPSKESVNTNSGLPSEM